MKNRICKISLFSAILASISALPSDARIVNAKNAGRSYADAYNQVNAMRYQQEYLDATAITATTASATATLPVMVSDEKLASAILNNSSTTTMAQLENCAMIYPNGVFRWEIPQSGIRQNQTNQCVAVVSLIDANTNAVLATTTLAAGDAMKCNIDAFPESGMNGAALSKTMLPADAAPTMEDVEKVLNQEQKQNAGIKIAAGAVVSALAGNAMSKKEAGSTGIIGTSKSQLTGCAIGAVTGAGIMAASTYTGKVAGDTIKSTAVNAASGAVIGNMMAGMSNAGGILVVKKCKIDEQITAIKDEKTKKLLYPAISAGEHDCIAGNIYTRDTANVVTGNDVYIVNQARDVKKCEQEGSNLKNCVQHGNLMEIKLEKKDGSSVSFDEIFKNLKDHNAELPSLTHYVRANESSDKFNLDTGDPKDDTYYKITEAYDVKNYQHAYIVFEKDISGKLGGHKTSELEDIKGKNPHIYMYRNSSGVVGAQIKDAAEGNIYFEPTSGNAEDGGLIDFSNQARTKGTIAGAAAGGALGGFAGYQGAQDEITDRWLSATREYEDSLSNFVCMTGNRFLSKYNDYVEIPEMNKSE